MRLLTLFEPVLTKLTEILTPRKRPAHATRPRLALSELARRADIRGIMQDLLWTRTGAPDATGADHGRATLRLLRLVRLQWHRRQIEALPDAGDGNRLRQDVGLLPLDEQGLPQ